MSAKTYEEWKTSIRNAKSACLSVCLSDWLSTSCSHTNIRNPITPSATSYILNAMTKYSFLRISHIIPSPLALLLMCCFVSAWLVLFCLRHNILICPFLSCFFFALSVPWSSFHLRSSSSLSSSSSSSSL